MYKIRNKAFDALLKKYDIESVYSLNSEQLREVCKDYGVNYKVKRNVRGEQDGLDMLSTCEILEGMFTFSEYMGDNYWEERQLQISKEHELIQRMESDSSGEDTFKKYARAKLGFHNLRPGAEVEVEWTAAFIFEVMAHKPAVKFLEITDAKTGKSVVNLKGLEASEVVEVEKDKKEVEDSVKNLTFGEIRKMVSDLNSDINDPNKRHKVFGKTRKDLVKLLRKEGVL